MIMEKEVWIGKEECTARIVYHVEPVSPEQWYGPPQFDNEIIIEKIIFYPNQTVEEQWLQEIKDDLKMQHNDNEVSHV